MYYNENWFLEVVKNRDLKYKKRLLNVWHIVNMIDWS